MKKKINPLKFIIYILALGTFFYFERELYNRYKNERDIRKYIRSKNSKEAVAEFIIRKKYFYLDKKYLKRIRNMTQEVFREEVEQSVR